VAEKVSLGSKMAGMYAVTDSLITADPTIRKYFESSPNTVNAISCVLRLGQLNVFRWLTANSGFLILSYFSHLHLHVYCVRCRAQTKFLYAIQISFHGQFR
jgi:hypothetical protein